jgi:hypothetical protein
MTLVGLSLFATEPQQPKPPARSKAAAVGQGVSKVWKSQKTSREYRVRVENEAFYAEWVNIPPDAARQGAYIRTECRRAGLKWVGSSSINMLFAVPGAPAGKDTKICHLTVRFEVDSISPEKIVGHSETLRNFDVNKCQVLQTTWGEFSWVPKK